MYQFYGVNLKKVLFLCGNLNNVGGTERVACLVANGLDNQGYRITLASTFQGNKPKFHINQNINVLSLLDSQGRALPRIPLIIFKIRQLLKAVQPDALIVVESMAVLFTLPAAIGLNVKHICWEHFNFHQDLGKVGRRVARQLAARFCDQVVTLTEHDKQLWLTKTRHKDNITAIPNPNPFPITTFTKKNSKVVLAAGRLVQQKGFDLLIEAWVNVSGQNPGWILKILGEGDERATLEKLIEQYGLSHSVQLLGNVSNVGDYYLEAEIFCLSSRFEGFPMVLLEALAFGLPIVSFNCDTGPEEILAGTSSILVENRGIKQLSWALNTMISDAVLRERAAQESLIQATKFEINTIIALWHDLLAKL